MKPNQIRKFIIRAYKAIDNGNLLLPSPIEYAPILNGDEDMYRLLEIAVYICEVVESLVYKLTLLLVQEPTNKEIAQHISYCRKLLVAYVSGNLPK